MRTSLPRSLADWLSTHHGVVTTATLRRHGVGRKGQANLLAAAVLEPVTRGTFVLTSWPTTLEHRCAIVSAAHPAGFVTGPTAGTLAALRRQPTAPVTFTTLHGRRLDPLPGVEFRQTTKITSADRRVRPDGIVVASWPRLAFDLAGDLTQLNHASVVHQLLDRQLVTGDELAAIARRLCHPGRRGSTTFQRTLESLDGATHDSHVEVELAAALRQRGVPVIAQADVTTSDGVTFHVDLGVPEVRWGVELDVHPEHRSFEGHHRDSRRVRRLHDHGWEIEPVAELDLRSMATLADELAALYRLRCRVAARGLAVPTSVPLGLGSASGLG